MTVFTPPPARRSSRLARFAAPLALAAGMSVGAAGAATEIADSPAEIRPLLIGSEAPSATVQTLEGNATDLRDTLLGKKSVLIFYRGGW